MARAGTVGGVILFVSVVVVGMGVGVATGTTGGTATTTQGNGSQPQLPEALPGPDRNIDPETTVMHAHVRGDGTAFWTVEYRLSLDDQNSTATFESLSEKIAANASAFTQPFGDRIQSVAETAANRTGRDMSYGNYSVETERNRTTETGIVRYRFRWELFAESEVTTLRIGDALANQSIEEGTRLRISWPSEYQNVSVSSSATKRGERQAVWDGPQTFGPGGPRVVGTIPTGENAAVVVALATLAAAIVGLGGYGLGRRRGLFDVSGPDDGQTSETTDRETAAADDTAESSTTSGDQADT